MVGDIRGDNELNLCICEESIKYDNLNNTFDRTEYSFTQRVFVQIATVDNQLFGTVRTCHKRFLPNIPKYKFIICMLIKTC